MSWIVPINKLDDQQRDFVDNVDIERQNMWIKGFPGSGKSVLLAHTIRKIKNKNSSASVLVVVFTHSLIKMFNAAFQEMGYRVDVVTFYDFMKSSKTYDYILSDEVQDLTPRVLSEMKRRAKHVVVAGDSNQSIYERVPGYNEEVVKASEINALLSSRDFELGIIHRLSSSIISVVQKFLPRMNIFRAKRDLTKQTTQVRLCEADSAKEESEYILKEAKKAINVGETVAILIPTQKKIIEFIQSLLQNEGKTQWEIQTNRWGDTDYSALNRYLASNNIPVQYVGNGYGEFSDTARSICIMTYHSSKGLDFDNVFLPYLNNSLFIVRDESLSKKLFMVAMTRSRNNLYLTYTGYKHSYLNNFASDCNYINIHDSLVNQNNISKGGSVFAGF